MKEIILERDNQTGNTVIVNNRHYSNVSLSSIKRMEKFILDQCVQVKITKLRYKDFEYVGIKADYIKVVNEKKIEVVCR
nr:MAG: hypothetical protein [uncultured cyanophage]WFD61423.1 MAG: hypothetical protein [uncultured cyanophage]